MQWLLERKSRRLSTDINLQINVDALEHLVHLPLSYHKTTSSNGDLRKVTEASNFLANAVRVFTGLLPQVLSITIGMVMAVFISVKLSIVLILSTFVTFLVIRLNAGKVGDSQLSARREYVSTWARATAAVDHVELVKQSTAEAMESTHVGDAILNRTRRAWHAMDDHWSRINGLQKVLLIGTEAIVFFLAVFEVKTGHLTIGDLVAFVAYAAMYLSPVSTIGQQWETLQDGITSSSLLNSIFSLEREKYFPEEHLLFNSHFDEIVFDNVSFSYEGRDTPVLENVTFSVRAGSTVAVVGQSGVGKSTLLSLISGYYFPTAGRILIGGVDTRHIQLRDLRKHIAIVPQEIALFNRSIKDNITYGLERVTEAEVKLATALARVDDFVDGLPDGLDTIVGERGLLVSLGQKQRIAIARAVVRNPAIFLFDEPTSALDPQTESLVSKAIAAAVRDKTSFIVAHRLSTILHADTILVFDRARLSQMGDHEQLMADGSGIYSNLYRRSVAAGDTSLETLFTEA